ncbi:MAG: DNA cytosine methyltransferase [Bacilli bacterium]|nr:DNA cytosine methyltransferase [Bacilli bacterium]
MKVISLFSGAGGLDLGFSLAGHEIVWANDFDEYALETYEKNFNLFNKHKLVRGDIVEYLNQSEEFLKKDIPDADIVIGGFPCQGFSIANINRNMNDKRNFLYLQVLKMIKLKSPKFILLENVKGLENMEKGKILSMIINDIENTGEGYTVYYNLLNALDYGVPQNRERIIIFGVRNDFKDKIKMPIVETFDKKKIKKRLYIPATHSINSTKKQEKSSIEIVTEMFDAMLNRKEIDLTKYFNPDEKYSFQTLRDTIMGLPEETNVDGCEILNHTSSKCKVVDKNSEKAKRVGNRPTDWNKHSPTIMGRGSGTGGPLIIPHPEYNRRMSVREVARIQTFPNTFEFLGSNSACYRQIGNAVPVLMAYNIAKLFPKKIEDFLQ